MKQRARGAAEERLRRPAAEPASATARSSAFDQRPRAVARRAMIQAMRADAPDRRRTSPAGPRTIQRVSSDVIIQRLEDPEIRAELAKWDLSALGGIEAVLTDPYVMPYFLALDTLEDLQAYLRAAECSPLDPDAPVPPPTLPTPPPPTVATPSATITTSLPSVGPATPLPPAAAAVSASAPLQTPKPSAPASKAKHKASSVPPPQPTPQAPTPVTGGYFAKGGYASAVKTKPAPVIATSTGAAAPAGPSLRAQQAISKFENWRPSEGHGGYQDLHLTLTDLDAIQAHAESIGNYFVVRGPGDGAAYSGFNQLKIIHAKMPAISGQKPTFHISYERR